VRPRRLRGIALSALIIVIAALIVAAFVLVVSAVALHGRTDDAQRLGDALARHEQKNGRWQ